MNPELFIRVGITPKGRLTPPFPSSGDRAAADEPGAVYPGGNHAAQGLSAVRPARHREDSAGQGGGRSAGRQLPQGEAAVVRRRASMTVGVMVPGVMYDRSLCHTTTSFVILAYIKFLRFLLFWK